jgi:hypothetical protein
MFEHCWLITLRGRMLSDLPPVYFGQVVSHRLLRYGSGLLHLGLAGTSLALAGRSRTARAALAGQLAFGALALAGRERAKVPGAGLAWYYALVTWATVEALANYVERGVPAVWEKPEGTR